MPELLAALFGIALLWSGALLSGLRARGRARAYWLGCCVMIAIGAAATASLLFFPLQEFDADGALIGEMPLAFGPSLLLLLSGVAATVIGLVILLLLRLIGRQR